MDKESMNKWMNIKSIMMFFSFLLALIFLITSISAGEALSRNNLSVNEIEEGELGKKIDRYSRPLFPDLLAFDRRIWYIEFLL